MTPHTVVFVLGDPGVGKTTVVRSLLHLWSSALHGGHKLVTIPTPKWTLIASRVCAAGHYTGEAFDGGDTVPYNGVHAALTFWHDRLRPHVPLTILDGDRFSHAGTLDFLKACDGVSIRGVYLDGSAVAAQRREWRAAITGKTQNPTWVRGRCTKAKNFAATLPTLRVISADGTPEMVFRALRDAIG